MSMEALEFYEPHAVCMLLAQIRRWHEMQGRNITLVLPERPNPVIGYIDHMGFFEQLGVKLDGSTPARSSTDRYVPIAAIGGATPVDQVVSDLSRAAMRARGGDPELEHLLKYAIGELLKNVQQHSGGTGFIMAQYYQSGVFSIGVADNGMGIRQSYLTSNSPRVSGREHFDDAKWIDEAILPESSSKVHIISPFGEGPVNRGVGLTICRCLAKECMGDFSLLSHSGRLFHRFNRLGAPAEPPATSLAPAYSGVACSITFNPAAFGRTTFMDLRRAVLRDLNLADSTTPLTGTDTMFTDS